MAPSGQSPTWWPFASSDHCPVTCICKGQGHTIFVCLFCFFFHSFHFLVGLSFPWEAGWMNHTWLLEAPDWSNTLTRSPRCLLMELFFRSRATGAESDSLWFNMRDPWICHGPRWNGKREPWSSAGCQITMLGNKCRIDFALCLAPAECMYRG